jgi:hypothetical protein
MLRSEVHDRMVDKRRACALVAAIAHAMVERLELHDADHVAACWWIALKFERGEPIYTDEIVRDVPEVTSCKALRLAEAVVLTRLHFVVPRDTVVHEVYALLDDPHQYSADLLVLLRAGMLPLYDATEWAHMLGRKRRLCADQSESVARA